MRRTERKRIPDRHQEDAVTQTVNTPGVQEAVAYVRREAGL